MKPFQYKNVTLGTDPEFFISDNNGKLISSIGIIQGTKDEPSHILSLGKGYAIQVDNVLGEFNVPPHSSPSVVADNVELMKSYITEYLSSFNLKPVYAASGVFADDQLQSDESKMFGCDPDYNAWTANKNEKPNGQNTNLRSAGCHIHVGYDDFNPNASLNLIKAMDLFVGVPSALLDGDMNRRRLYGKAGCFRLTPFGCEYRVLSGHFISSRELFKWSLDRTLMAIEYLNEFGLDAINEAKNDIIQCINTGDRDLAKSIISKFKIYQEEAIM